MFVNQKIMYMPISVVNEFLHGVYKTYQVSQEM